MRSCFLTPPSPLAAIALAFTTVGSLMIAGALHTHCGSHLAPDPEPTTPSRGLIESPRLFTCPPQLDLGDLRPGTTKTAVISLKNHGSEAVTVAGVKFSCACVTTFLGALHIAPRSKLSLPLKYDPHHDPDFRGRLAVVVEGVDNSGITIFKSTVHINILDSPRPAAVSYAEERRFEGE